MKKGLPIFLGVALLLLLLVPQLLSPAQRQAESGVTAAAQTPPPTAPAAAQATPQPSPTTDPACIVELEKKYFHEVYGESQEPKTEYEQDFEKRFAEMATKVYVPDLRKGEYCAWPNRYDGHDYPRVWLLASFPERDVYVFGYVDETYSGMGIILDTGSTQTIHGFPFYYSDYEDPTVYNHFTFSEDGNDLYFVYSQSSMGSPTYSAQIVAFDLTGAEPTAEYLTDHIADAFTDALSMQYNSATQEATLFLDGKELHTGRLRGNLGKDTDIYHPETFNCWERVGATVDENGITVCCEPTPVDPNGPFLLVGDETPVWASLRKVDGKWELYDFRMK